jgi:uncharacterized protein YjbI with pentapeptide repeats
MIIGSFLLAQAAAAIPSHMPAPEPGGCAAVAGAVDGAGATLPSAVDGTRLGSVKDLTRLRRRAKDGRVIVIEGGDFSNWDFRKAKLSAFCFRGTRLAASKWGGVSAPGMGFIHADLTGAQLAGARLPGVLLRTTTMTGADATNADLRGGRLDGGWSASLAGLRLDGANLAGFRFQCGVTETDGCPFDRQGITARGTDFSNALFDGFTFWDANVEGVKLNGAEIRLDNVPLLQAAAGAESVTLRQDGRRIQVSGPVAALLGRALAPAIDSTAQLVQPTPQSARLPERKLLFLSDRLPTVQGAAADPLWPQAVQALVALAPSRLLIVRESGGHIRLRGRAVAAGGGSCRITADALAPGAGGSFGVAPPARGRRRMRPEVPAVIVGPDQATIAPEQGRAEGPAKVVHCTGDASFGPMKRVPVDDLTFEALWSVAGRPPG